MSPKSEPKTNQIQVLAPQWSSHTFYILGTMPMLFNQVNEKARQELLFPSGRKSEADKQASLKHDPLVEFVQSTYRQTGDRVGARLYFPASGFKAAMCTAALDIPGPKKAQIGRLCWVEGERVEIYGVPLLFMRQVIQSGMGHTPDIRTRAILPRWACKVTVSFVVPTLKIASIANLLAAGGLFCGLGDYRQEKGKGSYGQWRVVAGDNAEWLDIVETEGRVEQDKALAARTPYDIESEEMLSWFLAERLRREANEIVEPKKKKAAKVKAGNGEAAELGGQA